MMKKIKSSILKEYRTVLKRLKLIKKIKTNWWKEFLMRKDGMLKLRKKKLEVRSTKGNKSN